MEILKKIQKKDEIRLLKCDAVKRFIKDHEYFLKRYQIDLSIKEDEDFFYFECLIQTLKNKEMFEGSFVRSYDDMSDYWQTLNYEERKRMINTDIDQIKKDLPFVLRHDQRLYLPCMNEKINAIYENEMVLFELKQYNRLRFDCKDMIDASSLTLEMVRDHFTSLEYVQGDEKDYWAYCPLNHMIYHFMTDRIQETFPLVGFNGKAYELVEWIELFKKDEDACLNMMIEKEWISAKMRHKAIKEQERRKK